jgi:dTDP-4-amino-4,6-dideoxygalactose transaminase
MSGTAADGGIPFARPFFGKEEEEAVLRVLRSGWLTTGGETLAFEKEFAAFMGTPGIHCLAVNSATSGLHLAMEACGVGPGDAVLVPSYTFTATAEVARYLGADPVFVDVAPDSFVIDAESLEKAAKRLPPGKAKAVVPVHFGGLPCEMQGIMDTAKRVGLNVIEDAAHSFPSALENGDFAGTIGDVGVFSFYATKTITTGEGGMVVCRDDEIASRVSIMRSHGIDRSVWNRYSDTKASWYYEVVEAGYKYNLPDLLAAVGRVQLTRAWDLLRKRQEIAAMYDEAFSGDERFIVPPTGPGDARHLYPLRLNPSHTKITRDDCIAKLKEAGVGASVHFIPLHTMPFYKSRYALAEDDFPHTMKSYRHEISLPIWPGMSTSQVERVVAVVQSAAGNYT